MAGEQWPHLRESIFGRPEPYKPPAVHYDDILPPDQSSIFWPMNRPLSLVDFRFHEDTLTTTIEPKVREIFEMVYEAEEAWLTDVVVLRLRELGYTVIPPKKED